MAVNLDLGDIQGIIARGYNGLRYARFTMFGVGDPAAGAALLSWLLPRITTASKFSSDTAVHVAFTAAGLGRLGLPEPAAAGVSLGVLGVGGGPPGSRWSSSAGWPPRTGAVSWATPAPPTRVSGPGVRREDRRLTA